MRKLDNIVVAFRKNLIDDQENVNVEIVLDRLGVLDYKEWILNRKSNSVASHGKLVKLDLSWLGLRDLPANFLNELQFLEDLRLDNNPNCRLKRDCLANLPNLKIVKLRYCKLKQVPIDAFGPTNPLKILDLSHNPLRKLRKGDFQILNSLTEMRLQKTELSKLSSNCFQGLSRLNTLLLENNDIKSIHQNSFKGLHMLKKLHLQNNELDVLHPNTFCTLKNLEGLYLDSNNLVELPKGIFRPLENLRNLSLFHNKLEFLGSELSNLPSLGKVCLETNLITQLTVDCFANTPNLKVVELQSNLIREIEKGSFSSHRHIEILNIQNNPLDFSSALELPETALFDYIPFISNLPHEELHEIIMEHYENKRLVDQAISLNLLSEDTIAFLRLTGYFEN